MKYSRTILQKKVIIDDYIPLLIKAEQKSNDMEYLYYRGENKQGLLEVGFDAFTQQVHKICLLICKDYRVIDAEYVHSNNRLEGDLLIDTSDDITTTTFFCEIYKDAISVVLSAESVSQTFVSDNIAWGVGPNGDLVSVTVYGLNNEVTMHAIDELSS